MKIAGRAYGVAPIKNASAERLTAAYGRRASGKSAPRVKNFDSVGALSFHGGPVMHSVTTHVIYWDPGKEFTLTTKGIVNKFFTDVAHDSGLATNVFGVAGQYTDAGGNAAYSSTYAGELVDSGGYPGSGCVIPAGDAGPPYTRCLTDAQLRTHLSAYVASNKLLTGPAQQYFVLLPHKVVTCFPEEVVEGKKVHPCSNNLFCAYHGVIGEGAGEIIYSDIPTSLLDEGHVKGCQSDGEPLQHPNGDTAGSNSTTRYADVMLKYISHEYIEASTDPQLESWFDAERNEIGDKCNSFGGPGEAGFDPNAFLPTLGGEAAEGTLFNQSINADDYYVQSEWDNGANACTMRPAPLEGVGFAPSSATALVGSPAGFSAAALDRYGGLGFSWTFGDGGSGAGSAPSHIYAAPGVYTVAMTAKDGLTGSTAPPVEHTIVVNDLPSASFAASPNPGAPGVPMEFNASASRDPDGAIVGYAWTFGDGTAASGASVSHAYAAAGTYTITVTVTDSAGQTAAVAHAVSVSRPGALANSAQTLTGSNFNSLSASVDASTGAITFTEFPANAGRFSWLVTFQNGRFGVYASRNAKCKPGFLRLSGRCRPARIVFAKGGRSAASAGAVSFTIRPTAAGLRALRVALKWHTGLAVLAALSFRSSAGGAPVTRVLSLTVRLKRK